MSDAVLDDNERERLRALVRTGLLDSDPDPAFDNLTSLLSEQINAPICIVSFIDAERKWFKSSTGLSFGEIPRHSVFSSLVIESDDIFIVRDALEDRRFSSHPMVSGELSIRSYLGKALHSSDGQRIGTLCVFDQTPRDWTHEDQSVLIRYCGVLETLIMQSEQLEASRNVYDAQSRLAREYHHQENLMNNISQIANVGGWRLDIETNELYWTEQTREIHEVPSDFQPELEGAINFYAPEARSLIEAAVERCMKEAEPWDMELPLITAKGNRIWVRACGACELENGEPVRLFGAFQDVTHQRRQKEELEKRSKIAEEATNAKTRFLATMSHELRTPLNGVVALAGTLANTELSDEQRSMVDLLQKSGESLNAILSDILDLSRIEEGKFSIKSTSFNFRKSLKTAVDVLRSSADEKGLSLALDVDPGLGELFIGDDVRIRQIISNLLSNAIKFTDRGSVRVGSRILRNSDGECLIRTFVEDTGVGIAEGDFSRIFNRFEQGDDSLTRSHSGTGLGLWVSRLLCEIMGGSLWVESTLGQGSTFSFDLPLKRAGAAAPPEELTPMRRMRKNQIKVLLAEDHPVNQRVFSIILRSAGYDFKIADNGEDAYSLWRGGDFSIVLMDIQMPRMDGLSVIRKIREDEARLGLPRTPISTVSANAMEDHRKASFEAGADLHISKPVTPEALLTGIDDLISGISAEDDVLYI